MLLRKVASPQAITVVSPRPLARLFIHVFARLLS